MDRMGEGFSNTDRRCFDKSFPKAGFNRFKKMDNILNYYIEFY